LLRDYPGVREFGIDAAHVLCRAGAILPVLDGLDEVLPEARHDVFSAIIRQISAIPGLILTCRHEEFSNLVSAVDVVPAAAVIAAQPLPEEDASRYLRRRLPLSPSPAWSDVLAGLCEATQGNAALREVSTTPLGLWLLGQVYIEGKRDPTELTDGSYQDKASLMARMFDGLIATLVANRRPLSRKMYSQAERSAMPRRVHDPLSLKRGLASLAEDLQARGSTDWLWWEYARNVLGPRWSRPVIRSIMIAVSAVWTSCLIGLTSLWENPTLDSFVFFSFVAALPILFLRSFSRVPAQAVLRVRGRRKAVVRALVIGLIGTGTILIVAFFGNVAAFAIDANDVSVAAIANAIAMTVTFVGWDEWAGIAGGVGIIIALIVLIDDREAAPPARSPFASYRMAQIELLVNLILFEVAAVILTSIGFTISPLGSWNSFWVAVFFNLLGGLFITLFYTNMFVPLIVFRSPVSVFWIATIVSRLSLDRHYRLPLFPATFLDDAYRLGLLRAVGSAYQFRHAELQDYLAPAERRGESKEEGSTT
jgi:hypothetical protein